MYFVRYETQAFILCLSPGGWWSSTGALHGAIFAGVLVDPQGEDGGDEDGAPHRHHQQEQTDVAEFRPANLIRRVILLMD